MTELQPLAGLVELTAKIRTSKTPRSCKAYPTYTTLEYRTLSVPRSKEWSSFGIALRVARKLPPC